MKTIIPPKLKKQDTIRIIAPSLSLSVVSKSKITTAKRLLEKSGFKVSFGRNVYQKDEFDSSSIRSRVADIREAFSDKKIKMILCALGGYNANQILEYLDYNLVRKNPKIFCGHSDITVLNNAIYGRSGLVTYSGPGFSAFAMKRGFGYSLKYFLRCLTKSGGFVVRPSSSWSDDKWYKNQRRRTFVKNRGWRVLQAGAARGKIIGGNLCTLNLLQGTKYFPDLRNAILFIEEDNLVKGTVFVKEFGRNLQSLVQQPGFNQVRGLVFGRFQKKCLMTDKKLRALTTSLKIPQVPIIAGVDFGHTSPQITFPIGGEACITAGGGYAKLEILDY